MHYLWLFIFLFLSTSINCNNDVDINEEENAKNLISDFGNFTNRTNLNKTHEFSAFSSSFLKRQIPFAELFATGLKNGLEENRLNPLLTFINGIDAKIRDAKKGQKYDSIVFSRLILDYYSKVEERIGSLLRQIRVMSRMKMNVTESLITTFVSECNSINSPATVAEYLAWIVEQCGSPHFSNTVTRELFNSLSNVHLIQYTLTTKEQLEFDEKISVIYFWLLKHRTRANLLRKFIQNHKELLLQNKLILLNVLMEALGIEQKMDTLCLPKAAFLAHGYKRDSIEQFANHMMNDILALQYITTFCANITFIDQPQKADAFTLKIGKTLKPVYGFVKSWFDSMLQSTWPVIESLMVREIMKDSSKGQMFGESNETYVDLLSVVHEKMKLVGHPGFRRQYISTKQFQSGPNSKYFTFNCKFNACTISSTMNAQVLTIRTQMDSSNEVNERLQALLDFKNESYPLFFKAMDSELYGYTYVERAVRVLATKYGLDFNNFVNHTSYVLIRKKAYDSGCSSSFAIKSNEDSLGNSFLQQLHYHEDGTVVTDCEDWLVVLGF